MPSHTLRIALILMAASSAMALTCSVSGTGVAFGEYAPLSGMDKDASGTVSVECTTLVGLFVTYQVRLSTGASGSYFPRRLFSGSGELNYNLYIDSAYTAIWGDGTGGTSYQSFSALLQIGTTRHSYMAYGRIPASQTASAGSYYDMLVVTVDY